MARHCRTALLAAAAAALMLLATGLTGCDQSQGKREPKGSFKAAKLKPASFQPLSWQRVYVPAYSHGYYDGGHPQPYEVTLSIRNVSSRFPVLVRAVNYHDTSGKLVKTFSEKAVELAPLETIEFLVPERDSSGGSGANFTLDWGVGSDGAPAPHVEAVMVNISTSFAVAFARVAVPVPGEPGN